MKSTALFTTLGLTFLAGRFVQADDAALSADGIIERVVSRARLVRELHIESPFLSESHVRTQRLDGDGRPKREACRVYENIYLANRPYQRLVAIDGRPLSDKEKKAESKRERKHREREPGEHPEEIVVDEELASKYHYTLKGEELIGGRRAYVVAFRPRHGLKADGRLDKLLNAISGRVFVDQSSYEIARVEFALDRSMRLLWGIGGALAKLAGFIERAPYDEGVWLPKRFEVVSKGRVLFKGFHSREVGEWHDFRRRAEGSYRGAMR